MATVIKRGRKKLTKARQTEKVRTSPIVIIMSAVIHINYYITKKKGHSQSQCMKLLGKFG